jgi:hypothetical protein
MDFIGTMIDMEFEGWRDTSHLRTEGYVHTARPLLGQEPDCNGEFWFEAVDWILSIREARERFVMITLGANYGYQAVGCYKALQQLNPMPAKLVAVDPIRENVEWIRRHMRDNGIDPADHWILQAVVSDSNEPVFFPIGGPGSGAQNCVATNERDAREKYVHEVIAHGRAEEIARNLLLYNSTGLSRGMRPKELAADSATLQAEIKLVSAVTLGDILGPLDRVDYLEADMQQSEIIVFPRFIDTLSMKVRRVHIGTHGRDVHASLHKLFSENGWEIVFNYEPEGQYDTPLGHFRTNDGVLSVQNPRFQRSFD